MENEPGLPIPISYIGSKYLLFDINAVTWLRKFHHICGVMTGTLPQSPSQNLFLGLPVHIMPEEAQLLVEKGVAFIVNDAKAHDHALQAADADRQTTFLAQLRKKGEQVSLARSEEKEAARQQSLKKAKAKPKANPEKDSSTMEKHAMDENAEPAVSQPAKETKDDNEASTALFDSPTTNSNKPDPSTLPKQLVPHNIIPTTSQLWLPTPPNTPPASETTSLLPNVPPSYALYKHLNSKSYFMTPGLRFGCQYCVYPGDPLRFHSHFLATGTEWDQEIDLMDIVGGGRLGTGVKKGFLIGGREPVTEEGDQGDKVRTFSIEWAAM